MMRLLMALLALWVGVAASPASARNDNALMTLPVLHDGRIKPLDTLARLLLQQVHGEVALGDMSSAQWMNEVLFDPDAAMDRPLFCVPQETIRQMLQLPPQATDACYGYRVISKQLEQQAPHLRQIAAKDKQQLSATEKTLWSLYEGVSAFSQLAGSLSLLLPLDMDIPPELAKDLPESPSYLDLVRDMRTIRNKLKQVVSKRGEDFTHYSDAEQKLAMVSFLMDSLDAVGRGNQLLRVIPPQWNESEEWLAPWALLQSGQGSPQTAAMMGLWRQLANAYRMKDDAQWQEVADQLVAQTIEQGRVSRGLLTLEQSYNRLSLIPKATLLYALAVCLGLAAMWRAQPLLWRLTQAAAYSGLALHAAVIISRMVVLSRPPVSTLYESILFVALVAAVCGMWLARRQKELLLVGVLIAMLLLAISATYAAQGDSMGMLIAVLNTRFWLATHVVCITIGYGCSLLAGTLAHYSLWQQWRGKPSSPLLLGTSVLALLFTAVGTMLGGIWADQSWGRFWGWDPKENGALLIVLWLAWLLHGRLTPYLSATSFTAWLALTNIVVALSWFGVNLLNVGLHAYGFTDAAAIGLGVFCALELALVVALYVAASMKRRRAA